MPIGGACSCQEMERMMRDFLNNVQSMIGGKGARKKRAPSEYNLFIGSCMKNEGKDMKTCATEYKTQKGQ